MKMGTTFGDPHKLEILKVFRFFEVGDVLGLAVMPRTFQRKRPGLAVARSGTFTS